MVCSARTASGLLTGSEMTGPLSRGEPEIQAHSLQRQEDVRENNGRVQVETPDGLQGHLGRQLRVSADLQERVTLPQPPVFGQVAARLAHHPDGSAIHLLEPASSQEASLLSIILLRHGFAPGPWSGAPAGLLRTLRKDTEYTPELPTPIGSGPLIRSRRAPEPARGLRILPSRDVNRLLKRTMRARRGAGWARARGSAAPGGGPANSREFRAMLLKVHSASVLGIQAEIVDVEVDFSQTMRSRYHVVGLPDRAVKESGERVRAAICNCGFPFPRQGTFIVNLAPAGFKKEGSCYDLPIALGILGLGGKLEKRELRKWLILGELSLDGKVRSIRGALPVALGAVKRKFKRLLLPAGNAREAAAVREIDVYCASSLPQVLDLLNGNRSQEPLRIDPEAEESGSDYRLPDFSHVKAQQAAKRAMEVACGGGHNLLLMGPPGAGKTMLARRIPSILPSMSFSESLETTAVHSVCGLLGKGRSILVRRPFRSPHHSISGPGLVGGGSPPPARRDLPGPQWSPLSG